MVRAVIIKISAMTLMVSFLLLPVFAAPVRAEHTIGIIMTGDIEYYHHIHTSFVRTMGGIEDVNFVIQIPSPEPMAWANAAKKLVVIGSEIIVTYGAPATLTMMKETATIPIVFAGVYDPASMNIPGKNATGISSKVPLDDLLRKLQSIKDFNTLGVVFNKAEKDTILQVMEIKKLEAELGFKTALYDSRKTGFVSSIQGVDALLLTTSTTAMHRAGDIVNVTRGLKIPSASTMIGAEETGIVLTISANPEEQGRVVGEMVIRLINGHKLSDMPVRAPKEIHMFINIKEASSIGLTVPPALAGSATRVIR